MGEVEDRDNEATEHHNYSVLCKPKDFRQVVRTELHHFSDASILGYGQCSYLRLVDEAKKVHCAFVRGKPRVASLKPIISRDSS